MNASKYLNGILTVNAILLAGLLWTQIANRPLLADEATAQVRSGKPGTTFASATQQRADMVRALKDMEKAIESSTKMMQSGKLKVQVTNLDEID